jgi:hypothetical protein
VRLDCEHALLKKKRKKRLEKKERIKIDLNVLKCYIYTQHTRINKKKVKPEERNEMSEHGLFKHFRFINIII